MSFFAELRRRTVFKVAASYIVVGWLIVQVVSALVDPLNLPDWFDTVVVVLPAIGFPLAVVFAWAFELTPDGIRLSQSGDAADPAKASKLDYALVAALIGVIAATLLDRVGTSPDEVSMADDNAVPSIAVLPLDDLSEAGDQEYFGDGIAEELLIELVRLDGLDVAGRTSSFSYKGRNVDLLTIGRELNVSAILGGSVRRADNTLRITAQLIDTSNGFHLWSQTFDEELTDIFEIQEQIARALELDPESSEVNAMLGSVLYASLDWIGGEQAHLRATIERTLRLDEAAFHIALNTGNSEDLRDALIEAPARWYPKNALFDPVLEVFDSPADVLAVLRESYADDTDRWPSKFHDISLLAAYFGDAELEFEAKYEEASRGPIRLFSLWYLVMSEVRRLPEFKDLMREINLVDYWRASGWADWCRPVGADDFTCS